MPSKDCVASAIQEHIAGELGISKAFVSRILKRRGLRLLSSIEPQEARPCYERDKPGEIVHLDVKKLSRFNSIGHRFTGRRQGRCSSQSAGCEYVHVAIDDHSRVAQADIFPDQTKESATAFLFATIAHFKSLGITVEQVMTDIRSCLRKSAVIFLLEAGCSDAETAAFTGQSRDMVEHFAKQVNQSGWQRPRS